MLLIVLVLVPLAGAAPVLVRGFSRFSAAVAAMSNAAVTVMGTVLSVRVVAHGPESGTSLLRADALSCVMVIVIGAIATLAASAGGRMIRLELESQACTPRRAVAYVALVQCFVSTMLVAVTAANMGTVWVGIEATTVVTTFLVGHKRSSKALEASWKYIVICSIGIALAFLGTTIFYFAAVQGGTHSVGVLDWSSLHAHAKSLDPSVVRLGFALVVLGYGTKVGLAPMHSWLPDAHSQAPAPVSALMSGVLLSVAFYAILRITSIADLALGTGFPRTVLVTMALVTLVLAASLLVTQTDAKRMLAYSSMEHMGLLALAAAADVPLAIGGALLHIIGHGVVKAVLFLSLGEIVDAEGTSRVDEMRSLLARMPVVGGAFGAGILGLIGLPPFSIFISEIAMVRGEFQAGLGWAASIAIVVVVVVFVAMSRHARAMLLGAPPSGLPPVALVSGGSASGRFVSGASVSGGSVPGGYVSGASVSGGALSAGIATGDPHPGGADMTVAAPPMTVAAPLFVGLAASTFIGLVAWPLSSLLHAAMKVVVP